MRFIDKLSDVLETADTRNIAKKFNINYDVVKILQARGYKTVSEVEKFLIADVKHFHDPFSLKNMDLAVERINKAIVNGERVLIYGDYDVDGITSTAILMRYFKDKVKHLNYFLPDRATFGYGLSVNAIEQVVGEYFPDLIITVDCGITSIKEVDYIKELGIDIIVTDHHQPPEILPRCICVNPKISNQSYPFKELCAGGVAFKLICALENKILTEYLQIASIATIADMVPLVDENRLIVKLGLADINDRLKRERWLSLMLKKLKIKDAIDSSTVGYNISPRLNSLGRLSNPRACVELILSDDDGRIEEILQILNEENSNRQQLTQDFFSIAEKNIRNEFLYRKRFIAVFDESYSSGINGLIATKIVSKYNRPAFVFSVSNDLLVGSARSISGVNIYDLMNSMSYLFTNFGGHTMAGGLSISKNKFSEFLCLAEEYLDKMPASIFEKQVGYDVDLTDCEINRKYVSDFDVLQPYGIGNEKPMFKMDIPAANASALNNYPNHIKFTYKNIEYIYFNGGDRLSVFNSAVKKQVICDMSVNAFLGRTALSATIKQEKVSVDSDLQLDSDFKYLQQLYSPESSLQLQPIESGEFASRLRDCSRACDFGTLVIVNTAEGLSNFKDTIFNHIKDCNFEYYFDCVSENNLNSVVFLPNNKNDLSLYDNVFFVELPLNASYIERLSLNKSAKIFVQKFMPSKVVSEACLDRDKLVNYYKLFVSNKDKLRGTDFNAIYESLKCKNTWVEKNALYASYLIFLELKILVFNKQKNIFDIDSKTRVDLLSSKVYNYIKKAKECLWTV